MFFLYRPQSPSPSPRPVYHDPDEAFVEFKRREYIAALEEAEQRAQFRQELVAEEERHRRALDHIARQEAVRRQRAETLQEALQQQADHSRQEALRRQALRQAISQSREAKQAEPTHPHPHPHPRPTAPSPQEILRRRLERQKEEERRSREYHRRVLNDIFGVPTEVPQSSTPVTIPRELPQEQEQQLAEEAEPHWSEAPERSHALAAIAAINRAFLALKNTFTFPTGSLERVPDSEAPKLAYNPTNATIHAYEHALTDLLSKLDGIESHGFKGIRQARKQLVVKIEEELLALERKIAENIAPAPAPAAVIPPASTTATDTDTSAPTLDSNAKSRDAEDVEMAGVPQVEPPSHTPNPGGYDVEVEDIFVAPTPQHGTGAESHIEQTTTTAEDGIQGDTSEVPVPLANPSAEHEVPSEDQQSTQIIQDSHTSDVQVASAPEASTDSTNKPANTTLPPRHAPTISVSDEEDEIDDAVHVITEEDGTKAKAGKPSDQDGEYELV